MFLSCAAGAVVKTFELSSESILLRHTMVSQREQVTCARYNHNGRLVASSATDGAICLDVATSGELLSRFFCPSEAAHDHSVNCVHFSGGSRFLASGSSDGCVRVWDLKTQEVSQTYRVGTSAVTAVTFSGYKDERIVAGTASGAIAVIDVQSSEQAGFLSVDPDHGVHQVSALQASPHPYARHVLGSVYTDGSVRVWDLSTGQLTAEFVRQHEAAATALVLSPVSKVLLATAGLDGRVLFFDTLQQKELRSLQLDQPISALALCADGKTLAVGTITGEILVYDLRGVITPLYSTVALDGSPISSLHFAPAPTDAASSIAPQGQPVVSAEHVSPVEGETVQAIALRKLQALGLGDLLQSTSRPASPTAPRSPSITQPLPTSPERPQALASSTSASPSRQGSLHVVEEPPDNSNTNPFTRTRSESSLLAMLVRSRASSDAQPAATSVPPTAITDQKPSNALRTEIDRMRQDMETRHQKDHDQLSGMLSFLLDRYDDVIEENHRLRLENERLKTRLLSDR